MKSTHIVKEYWTTFKKRFKNKEMFRWYFIPFSYTKAEARNKPCKYS